MNLVRKSLQIPQRNLVTSFSKMTALKPASDQIEIEIMTEADRVPAIEFLRLHYFKDEALNKCLDIVNEQRPICEEMENFETRELKDGLSVKAVRDGKIVGLSTGGIVNRGYENEENDFVPKDEKFAKIITLLDYIKKNANIFQHFPDCDRAYYWKSTSIDPKFRNHGIGGKLIAAAVDLAKQRECDFMVGDCTSQYMALILTKLGFKQIWKLNYCDYKVDGKIVFHVPPPQDSVMVFAQRISAIKSF